MSANRLAYLLKKFPRLSETFVLNEILGQEALGRDLHVFSRRTRDAEPTQPQLARLRAPIEVLPPSSEIDPWSELFGDEADELLPRVRALVGELRPLGHARLPSLVAEALWLRRRARELDVRHVHVHFATDSAVTARCLHALGGPTYSITAHAKDIYRDTVSPRVLDDLVAHAAFVVTVCDANVDYMRSQVSSRAAAKIRRLYNGIDLELFRRPAVERRPAQILSVGRLVEKKGFDVLIDALGLLAERNVAFEAVIAGDGEDRALVAARVEARGLAARVRLTGPIDQTAVRALMHESTLFCLPCKIGADGNRDALPTVLLEAQAAELPCISTPVSGVPEILDHGRAGLLAVEGDVVSTADAMQRLLAEPATRARLAERGLEHAREHFDVRKTARVLGEWFDEVVSESTCTSST
ncbi:MAG: glycosyltransferase family 4 protein [Planctomycetes bacterium]|nr:glycosyltransferase family 4 protein [Planctomycetota bacterium]